MRVLRTIDSIKDYINSTLDRSIADHLAAHVAYVAGDEGEPLTVIVVEPLDSLVTLDVQLGGDLLSNPYSGRSQGDSGFVPCFETLEEHASFYEMFFLSGDEGTSVIVPRRADIDGALLDLCAAHATPFQEEQR
jgi:hypothetical protein